MKALCKIRGLFYFVKPVRFMQGIKLKKLLQQQILLGLYSGTKSHRFITNNHFTITTSSSFNNSIFLNRRIILPVVTTSF
jgi:hypothetical protein